jgi:HEAT repeat protein
LQAIFRFQSGPRLPSAVRRKTPLTSKNIRLRHLASNTSSTKELKKRQFVPGVTNFLRTNYEIATLKKWQRRRAQFATKGVGDSKTFFANVEHSAQKDNATVLRTAQFWCHALAQNV